MATNPNEKPIENKNPPSLFGGGGGLFGNPPPPGTGLFGNASKPGGLFGAPSPSSAPAAFSPIGQQQPITPLFGNAPGQPQSAPSSLEASKTSSLFSGGLGMGALGANKPSDGSQNKPGLGLFGQSTSTPMPSLFGPPKQPGQSELAPSGLSTPVNPAPTTTNPMTLSFGSTQQPKKEEPAKKTQAPSLFGTSGPQTGSLFGGTTSMFGQPAKTAEGDKNDEKKPAFGSLFGAGFTSSVSPGLKDTLAPKKPQAFGLPSIIPSAPIPQAKPMALKAPQAKETPSQETPKNPLGGSLFSNNPAGSLFGAGNSGSAPSLFGGVTPTPQADISPVPTTTPAPSLFQAPTPKPPSLFGSTGASLFGATAPSAAQPPASEKPKNVEVPITLSAQSLPKIQKPIQRQAQQPQTLASKTEGSSKPEPPKPTASTFLSSDSKQPKKEGTAMPSLFGGSTATGLFSNKPAEPTSALPPKQEPLSTASEPKPIIQSRPDTLLPSLTERRRKEPAADPEHSQTIRSNESAESSILTKEKTQNDFATRQTKNTGTVEGTGGPKLFSFLKPKEANTAQVLDFKALMQEKEGQMFSTFLSQSSQRIITSIKMYFTIRLSPFKPKEQPQNATDKERFLFDFTNLFVKVLGLSDESYPLAGQFLRRVIAQQRYERLLFKDDTLAVDYFRNNMIYQVGLGNSYFLNEGGSRELQFLVERMVNKWNVERVGVLNFLLSYSDLMKRPSDLFAFLFRHLLEMDGKLIETQNKQYVTFIKDFEFLTKRKLLEVISFYNGRLREFKLIPAEEIRGIVLLLEANRDETINEVSLKVLLNSLNFKQPKEIPADVFEAIRQTKSECMMPLRALAHKLTSKRHDFVPCPKELYKYIRGDEWADWFDIYLSDSGKEGVELQTGEAEEILQSLCSISGPLLLERMMDSRKGLLRFFNLLRDENMVTLYYRLLEACVYDNKSIGRVDEFYFKKMHFNLEYQEVIEYVIAFNEQQPHANEEAVLAVLEVKLGLLAKIIEVAPERLVELQRYLFYHDYNRHKKFRGNVPEEFPRAEGEKLVHLFLDTVNIVSLKGIPNRILHRIFRVLAHLLRSQQTQEVALAALRTNRPSFAFLNTPLHPLTLNALNSFLEQVLAGHYLHDLAADYAQAREDQVRAEAFYPFRYRDAELASLMRHEATGTVGNGQFSIYWMNQLVRVVAKQRFNPYLLFKMLQKLHIEPYSQQNQSPNGPVVGGLYQKRSLENRIPTIFEPIVSVLNEVALWEEVARVLQFKIVRCEGRLQLANKLILCSPSLQSEGTLLFTLKLVRLCFQLNALLSKYEQSAEGHFAVRTLSAVNFLSRGKIGSQFATNASRNNILLSVLALLHLEGCENNGAQGVSWEAEQGEEDHAHQALVQFINRNQQTIDFQQASNFLRRPNNALYEAENSIVGVSLQVMLDIVRLSPECSLEHSLTTFLPLKEEEKAQLKLEVLTKLSSSLTKAIDDPRVDYRVIEFIYSLKHDCGANKLHGALSNRLFEEFIKSQKELERSVSFKAALSRYLLKELSEGNPNYETFTEQFLKKAVEGIHFRDTVLREGSEFKEMRQVGRMVRNYHSREHSLLSLNQLERMVEERAIVEIGRQFETLSSAVDIIMAQLLRRKHSQGLLNCLCVLNHLILNKNLLLLEQDLPDSTKTRPAATSNLPRLYLRDPLQAYISEGGAGKHGIAQLQQKNNVVEWILSRAATLSGKITTYFKFILTIDRYLYANNPVAFTVERPDIIRLDLFCHLALGSFNFAATELFGKNSTDAVETVQGLASNLLTRLTDLAKGEVREGGEEAYGEGLRMLGYCLQWLRGKEKHGETASQYLIRKLQKSFQVLLPSPSHFLTPEALKVLLSALSMGVKHFSAQARTQVREAVYAIVQRYWQVLQRGLGEEERSIGQLFQQAATVLILLPPEKNQAFAFELLVNIWTRERNFQFFFNESRLMIELARACPQELVKLQPLTRCQIITALSPRYSRYSDDERRFDGVAWTWAMRVAAQLANHPLSILVVSEVSAFLKKYRERIQALFQAGDKLSRSYLQDLQVALELLASLFSHDLWVNFNRKLAEELTYLLSHRLIRVFVLYAQGRLSFAPNSSNDRELAAVRCLGEEESPFDSLTQETVFSTEMRIRVNYCLRNYCLVMSKAFRTSHYVETYFETPVLETSKYFSSFWDGFGKQLTSLFVYAGKQFKLWSGLRRLNEALSTMAQCSSAPHSFVENGYLCTVEELPRNDYELFSDLYLLNYLLTELAAVHLLKERLYVGRFNSLMATHADSFAKRIREHVEGVRVESKRVHVDMGQYVSEAEFTAVVELIESGRNK